jgi:hypothetical protein
MSTARCPREDAMTNTWIKHVIGLVAAGATTLALFSAVASLADDDRAALVAARTAPTVLADRSADLTSR